MLFQPHTMMWSLWPDEPKPWPSLSRKSMTIATRAPVIMPSMATPNRISNQLTTRPPGEVTNAESPAPRTVAIPQLNESNERLDLERLLEDRDQDRRDRDDDDDALGQRDEEPAVELTADAPQVPGDPPDDRAGSDRERDRRSSASTRSCHRRDPGCTSSRRVGGRVRPGQLPACHRRLRHRHVGDARRPSAATRSAGARWRLTP